MSSSNQRPANRGFRSVLRCAISHYRQSPLAVCTRTLKRMCCNFQKSARGYRRTVRLEKARDGGVVGRLKRRSQNRIPAPNRTSKSRTCARRNHREPIERSTPTPTCGKIPKRMLAGSSAHGRVPVKSTRNRCMGTGGVSITGWPSARQGRLARCANRIPRNRCGVQRGFLDKRQYAVTPPTCSSWVPPRARSTTISCPPRCS